MELTIKTFGNGIQFLQKCYVGFTLPGYHSNYIEWLEPWYSIIKLDISDEEFMPLLVEYCRTQPVPTCPADIINFKLKNN